MLGCIWLQSITMYSIKTGNDSKASCMWPAVLLWLHSLLALDQTGTSSKGSNLECSYSNDVYSPSCMDLVICCHNGCDVRSHFDWAVYTASSSHLLADFPVNVTSFTSVSVTLVKKKKTVWKVCANSKFVLWRTQSSLENPGRRSRLPLADKEYNTP